VLVLEFNKTALMHASIFDEKEIGNSLRKVSVETVKTETQDIISHWYHSDQEADLYFWVDENSNIIRQQLSFFGQVVEWNLVEGVKTGITEVDENKKIGLMNKEKIVFDMSPQAASVGQAISLMENLVFIDKCSQDSLVFNFKTNPQISEMNPKEVMAKYGAFQGEPSSQITQFFSKIMTWLCQ